jgi:hypothetical protein
MPQLWTDIIKVKREVFKEGHYNINILIDRQTGITLKA